MLKCAGKQNDRDNFFQFLINNFYQFVTFLFYQDINAIFLVAEILFQHLSFNMRN